MYDTLSPRDRNQNKFFNGKRKVDIASLTRRDLPFKPPPKGLKAAFDSPLGKVNRQEPVLKKHFKFDLEKIFTE